MDMFSFVRMVPFFVFFSLSQASETLEYIEDLTPMVISYEIY